MTRTWSRSGRISSSTAAEVAGLMAAPTDFPNALMRCTVRDRSLFPSQWTRKESVPACANSSTKKSGLKIIRCVSSGRRVTLRSDSTITAPSERFGTKCPSMTSTWNHSCGTGMSFFKSVHKLPIAAGHLSHSGLPRGLLITPEHKRLPEVGPTHGEADEAWYSGRRRQPFAHLFVVFAAPQDDAADFVATAPTRGGHNLRAILAAVQPLDLPHVRLYLCVLELLDALDHKPGAQLQIVGLLVALKLFKLRLLRRYQQLEHKQAATLTMQVVRQPLQPSRLPAV